MAASPAAAPAPAPAGAPAPAAPKRTGKAGFLKPDFSLARTKSSQAHKSQCIVKLRTRVVPAGRTNPKVFAERHVLEVVEMNGEDALPKKLGCCSLCFSLIVIRDASAPLKHLTRSDCSQPAGRRLALECKGASPFSPVKPDGTKYWSFKTSLVHHIKLVRWIILDLRPFKIVEDDPFRDFCASISGGKYKPCSAEFVVVLIKIIHGLVVKKLRVLLKKILLDLLGLPGLAIYFDTWTGRNHKGFLGVSTSA